MEFGDITWILLATALSLLVYLYIKIRTTYQYWENRGIAYAKPIPIIGNLWPTISMKKSIGEIYKEIYLEFPNERVVGAFEMLNPVLVIRDPELVEKILVKDFQHFVDHTKISEDKGLFAKGLFQLRGSVWRSVRHKISPAFTSGKLKGMFTGMVDCTDEMLTEIDKNLNKDYVLRDAIAIYAIDVIANTVFGIQIGDKQTRDEFVTKGSSIFNTTPARFVEAVTILLFPKLANLLGFQMIQDDVQEYFKGLIRNTLREREQNNYQRNDYTQQLLKLKQQGSIEVQSKNADDDYLKLDSAAPSENIEISEELLAGQAFQFLSAGFDPLLCTTVYVLYDLALNPEVQQKARDHVKETLNKYQEYSYECAKDMTYIEQCIQETLRVHVLTPFLFRECTKKYYIPEEKLEIRKGQRLVIPLNAIQMDPKYHDHPEIYNPDRLPPNSLKNKFTYLPFGDGPRMCIGIRYAMIVMKLGLAKLLSNYKFALSPKTKVPFEANKQSTILLLPKHDILFNVSKI